MIPKTIYIYRITHIDNLDYVLDKGKLTCPNHPERDLGYIGIGNTELIGKRAIRQIDKEPFGTFTDYVSFYFGHRSPMLYNIVNGYSGATKRSQNDIIYLVTTSDKIKESGNKFVFFDGHGSNKFSKSFNDDSGIIEIDWETVKAKFWFNTDDDPDRERRKQAEFLVHSELEIKYLTGIGVYDETVQQKILTLLKEKSVNLKCIVKSDWYY